MTGYAYHHETDDGVPCIRLTTDKERADYEAEGPVARILATLYMRAGETADFFPDDQSYPALCGAIERAR